MFELALAGKLKNVQEHLNLVLYTKTLCSVLQEVVTLSPQTSAHTDQCPEKRITPMPKWILCSCHKVFLQAAMLSLPLSDTNISDTKEYFCASDLT